MQQLILPDGEPIDVHIEGQGQPLVLLHGWTSGPHIWLPFCDELAKHFKVYVWRARGHRPEPLHTGTEVTLTQLANDLHAMLEMLDIKKPILVGHSMGAMLTWQYLRLYGQDHLSGLLWVDQSPCLMVKPDWPYSIYGHFSEEMNQQLTEEMYVDFAEAALHLAARGRNEVITAAYKADSEPIRQLRNYLKTLYAPALIELWQDMTSHDWRDVVANVTLPVSLLYGGKSQFYPIGVVDYLQALLPQAQARVFDEADHSPQISAPAQFSEAFVEQLLRIRNEARTSP
ncbi:alpha/beta fold hydrolase [Pokkaliibacter sp. CJK22405]|uniref:alpha/beta fold hydrolase n=1 Tax=Pokkaliibacter sp. CJK22405 TaxID=3384615 RepID=UPI003985088F